MTGKAMTQTIEQRIEALEKRNAELEAALAAATAPAEPAPQTSVICTDCLAEVPIEDAENWPDPEQGDATRYRCKLRTPCKARVKEAAERAREGAG